MTRALPLLLIAAACGPMPPPARTPPPPAPNAEPAPSPAAKRPPELDLEPLRIKVVRRDDGTQDIIHYDARALLDRGNEALSDGRFDDALRIYDQLAAEFPGSSLLVLAEYNAGQAHEGLRAWDAAVGRYRRAIAAAPTGRDSVDAHLRIGVILAEQARWGEAAALFEELLARTDLRPDDRIEGLARLGYSLVEERSYVRAERVLSDAVAYYARVAQSAELETNYFVAMCNFYLARIAHRQAAEVPLRVTGTDPEQLKKDLAQKQELYVLAYDRYIIALQRRHPYWATAAGYQMSQMFKEFWDDVVRAPVPTTLSPQEAGYYRRALHDYMREFLERAMTGHTRNVELADAYRTSTEWSRASETRAKELATLLSRETRGELTTPEPAELLPEPARDASRTGDASSRYVPARVEL